MAGGPRPLAVKIALYILLGLLIALQYPLWLGSGGLVSLWKLKSEIAVQKTENASLRQHNSALEAEVQDLKQGLASAEERARLELGMVKKGESFYQIIENQNRNDSPHKPPPAQGPSP
jgi:cell division protein FtsB